MKQTLFTKQLAEYFNIYLPINKKCCKNTISSYADGFVALFQFFKEIKGIPHYRINYSDITIKTNPESIVVSLMASHNVEAPAEDTEAAEEK